MAAARSYFGDRIPLGAQISFNDRPNAAPVLYQIVGVVKDARSENPREPDSRRVYLPLPQALNQLGRLTLAVRVETRPTEMTNAITNDVRSLSPDILLTNIATLS